MTDQENTQQVKVPDYCPACLNDDCVEHIDEGDEQDSDGTFGNHIIRCTVCGRRTDSMDTFTDAVEAWEADDVHYMGTTVLLIPTETLRELCRYRKEEGCNCFCHNCDKASEQRELYPS